MKRTYEIRELKAVERFRSHLANDPVSFKGCFRWLRLPNYYGKEYRNSSTKRKSDFC